MTRQPPTPADRLSLSLFLAATLHALVILGVGFKVLLPEARREPPLMEVTLAERPIDKAPKDHDYLAQANQDGGGESLKRERPRKPSPALTPGLPEGRDQMDVEPGWTPPNPAQQQVIASPRHSPQSSRQQDAAPEQTSVTALDLINASQQVAQASALPAESDSFRARFPEKRRLDARTKEHSAAAYMRDWVTKVEQVGNLNYPDEARRRHLSGSLILEVILRPDGSLYEVRPLKPSPHTVLNDAAMRIVRIAAPYAPVPPEVLQGSDLLVITRTWEFIDETGLSTRAGS